MMIKGFTVLLIVISLCTGCTVSNVEEDVKHDTTNDIKQGVESEREQPEQRIVETGRSKESIKDTVTDGIGLGLLSDIRGEGGWNHINNMCEYLGKTANEIVEKNGYYGLLTYVKKGQIDQLILDAGATLRNHKFSGEIWDKNSRCLAIQAKTFRLSGLSYDEFITSYGGDPAWIVSTGGNYYQYTLDDGIEVRFYTDESGAEMSNTIMVCSPEGYDAEPEEMLEVNEPHPIDMKERGKPEWGNLEHYMSYAGKSYDELKAEYSELKLFENARYAEDSETGVCFILDGDNICSGTMVPPYLFFEDMEIDDGVIGREDIMEYWPVDHSWYVHEGSFYMFKFEDIYVYVHSELDGTLDRGSHITIKDN